TNNRDSDGDGILDVNDNCPLVSNPNQLDGDGDGIGDACDNTNNRDSDGDGILDVNDNCPLVSNPNQLDGDGDGIGDACDNTNEEDDNDNDNDDNEDDDSPRRRSSGAHVIISEPLTFKEQECLTTGNCGNEPKYIPLGISDDVGEFEESTKKFNPNTFLIVMVILVILEVLFLIGLALKLR
ncbi:MAG: thrombospondin type 3 repeat-containing protein, partial [Candidatus Pacearchaeota archaeon]